MSSHIVVINPNSTRAVTTGISDGLAPLRLSGGPTIECVTLAAGPPAVETDAHIEEVVEPLCALMSERREQASAFVIACYSDPGLAEARARFDVPAFGIAESAMLVAMARADSFGVLSLFPESVARHTAYVERLGLSSRMAGDLPLGLGVLDFADADRAMDRLVDVGSKLRDDHAAAVLILGCTGMAPYRLRLEDELGVPVIDPTQAAVTLAIGTVQLAER